MKTITYLVGGSQAGRQVSPSDLSLPVTLPQLVPDGIEPGETVKHILLGSPGAVRQTIHLLHTLRYAETVLWSPTVAVEEQLIITPAQGEAMSLLRRLVR